MMPCQRCGADNRREAVFCMGCGARLDAPGAEAERDRPQAVRHSRTSATGSNVYWRTVLLVLVGVGVVYVGVVGWVCGQPSASLIRFARGGSSKALMPTPAPIPEGPRESPTERQRRFEERQKKLCEAVQPAVSQELRRLQQAGGVNPGVRVERVGYLPSSPEAVVYIIYADESDPELQREMKWHAPVILAAVCERYVAAMSGNLEAEAEREARWRFQWAVAKHFGLAQQRLRNVVNADLRALVTQGKVRYVATVLDVQIRERLRPDQGFLFVHTGCSEDPWLQKQKRSSSMDQAVCDDYIASLDGCLPAGRVPDADWSWNCRVLGHLTVPDWPPRG